MNYEFQYDLSKPEFDCLGFSDVQLLTLDQKTAVMKCMDQVFLVFARAIQYRHPPAPPTQDPKLRLDLFEWGQTRLADLSSLQPEELDEIMERATSMTKHCFPLASDETRRQMAMGIACAFNIDDQSIDGADLRSFQYDLWQKKSPRCELLAIYMDFIRGFVEYFGTLDPRIGSLGGNGWANVCEARAMEGTIASKPSPQLSYTKPNLEPNRCYPDSFALQSRLDSWFSASLIVGIFKPSREAEVPFEYWITSLHELKIFISMGNDLFSWPKEVIGGKSCNYMSLRTRSKRQSGSRTRFTTGLDGDELWSFRDTICEAMSLLLNSTVSLDKAFVEFAG